MKQSIRTFFAGAALLAALSLAGCGAKSGDGDTKAGATPAQTTKEGERIGADRTQHYQQAAPTGR